MFNRTKNYKFTLALGSVIARYCGHGNAMKYDDLAERAGCSGSLLRQLAKQTEDKTFSLSFDMGASILAALPVEAQNDFFSSMGLTGAQKVDDVPPCFHAAHDEIGQTNAAYTKFLRDGKLDHREKLILVKQRFSRLIAVVSRCMRYAA